MIHQIVAMYEKGAITAHHLVVDCLTRLDPADPAGILDDLPGRLLPLLTEFVEAYSPDQMISNYRAIPSAEQVEAAKRWIVEVSKVETA